jgi:putative oxidoreductase
METTTTQPKGIKIAAAVVRYLLGLMFFIFGLNGYLNFMPMPPMEGNMLTYMTGLMASGYFLPLLKFLEVLIGALLLSGFYVPLALAILGPISLNIFMIHASIAPEGLPMAIFVLGGNIFLAWVYRENFKGIFARK